MTLLKTVHSGSSENGSPKSEASFAQFVPIAEIHRRVAKIKQRWSPEIAQARAAEGERRRGELESLLAELELGLAAADQDAEECEFSIVG